MITFTLSGIKYLVKKRVAGALELLKRMLRFLSSDDKRWPQEKDPGEQRTPGEIKANKARFKKLLAALV